MLTRSSDLKIMYKEPLAKQVKGCMFSKKKLYLSSKPLACILIKSIVVSHLIYCLPVLFTGIYARDKKALRNVFQDAQNLGLEVGNLDTIVRQRTTTQLCAVFLMQIISYTIF